MLYIFFYLWRAALNKLFMKPQFNCGKEIFFYLNISTLWLILTCRITALGIMLVYTELKEHATTQESSSIHRGMLSLYFGLVYRNVRNKSFIRNYDAPVCNYCEKLISLTTKLHILFEMSNNEITCRRISNTVAGFFLCYIAIVYIRHVASYVGRPSPFFNLHVETRILKLLPLLVICKKIKYREINFKTIK